MQNTRFFSILMASAMAFCSVSAAARESLPDNEQSQWRDDYQAEALAESAPEEGWSFRAEIVSDWGSPMSLVSLHVPLDSRDLAWIEVVLPREWDRPRMRFEAYLEEDDRYRLLGGLVTRLAAPETDNSRNHDGPICIHAWGADTLFMVNGEQVRTLTSDACNHNDAVFDFALAVVEAAHAELPECRDMASDEDNALFRLSQCSLLIGDSMLAGRFFQPLLDVHRDWPLHAYTDGAYHVEWERAGPFANQDVYEELVVVRYHSLEGLPQGEVKLSMIYFEELGGQDWSWDASEIWTRDEHGSLRLVSLQVTNPQLLEDAGD